MKRRKNQRLFYQGSFLLIACGFWFLSSLLDTTINPYVIRVLVNCGISSILALSLNLINGCAGQFSLGHGGFMGVGAYTASLLTTVLSIGFFRTDIGFPLAVIIGGIVASFFGYIVGLPSLRLKGDYLAIVTLGFGEIIRITFLNIPAVGGAVGLPGIPILSSFFGVYFWVLCTFYFIARFLRSKSGRAILAIRDDEIAASSMGIDVAKYKVLAFVISSGFAGIAGGLFAHFQGFIDPNSFNYNRSIEIVIMVVLGGMGSLSGSILGAFIVTILPEVLRFLNNYRMIVFPTILILLMLLRPMGLMGTKEIWQIRLWRRLSKSS